MSFNDKSLSIDVPVDEALEVVIYHGLSEDESLGDWTMLTAEEVTHLFELFLTTYFSLILGRILPAGRQSSHVVSGICRCRYITSTWICLRTWHSGLHHEHQLQGSGGDTLVTPLFSWKGSI